jgi:23S rRNA (adenine2030-N6)-methyltransferase
MDGAPLDYSHRFHVANHGDVWKHTALIHLLDALRPSWFLDTHAGEGSYELGPTGEWTAGAGKIWADPPADPLVQAWIRRAAPAPPPSRRRYPGSPALAAAAIGAERLHLFELQADAAGALRQNVGPAAQITIGDGFLAALPPGAGLVHIDPPFVTREDWTRAPDVAAALHAASRAAEAPSVVMLWYPIKSWSRPNLLLQRLRDRRAPFVALDLVVTPLELKRPQLAGSGIALLGAPEASIGALCAAASALGPRLATHDGRWQLRVSGA